MIVRCRASASCWLFAGVSAFRAEQLLWALAGVTVMGALTVIRCGAGAFLSILVALIAGAGEWFERLSGA